MNIIGENQNLAHINNILTITVINKPPEIYLLAFFENQI